MKNYFTIARLRWGLALAIVTVLLSCASTGGGVTAAKEYYDLGLLYESQKDGLSHAVEMYTKAIKLDPTMRSARYNLAHAQILMGNFDAALTILQAMQVEDPKNQAVLETLAYLEAKKGQLAAAWDDYQAVLKLTEGRESVLFNLTLIGKALGKKNEAYEYALRLVSLKPTEPMYQRSAGLLGLELGKIADSEPLIAGYLLAKEKDVPALLSMAEDLAALGFHSRALTILDGILAADGKNTRALFIQAREYVAGAQDLVKGKASLQKALEAGFSDDTALSSLVAGITGAKQADYVELIKKFRPEFKFSGNVTDDGIQDPGKLWDPLIK